MDEWFTQKNIYARYTEASKKTPNDIESLRLSMRQPTQYQIALLQIAGKKIRCLYLSLVCIVLKINTEFFKLKFSFIL